MKDPFKDEIVEEIRRRREAHSASFAHDPKRIAEDLQRQERESGVPIVNRQPREPLKVQKRSST